MNEKYYELTSEEITYILSPALTRSYETPRFETVGILMPGQAMVYAVDSSLVSYRGVPTVDVESLVRQELLSEMDRQLGEYAATYPDILSSIGGEAPDRLAILLNTAGKEVPFRPRFWLNWPHLDQGLVRIALNQCAIQYSLKTRKFSKEDGAPLDIPLYEQLDPVGYWQQIAAKQREIGIQNAGYTELARINRFLDGCRSVHVLLRDGREFTVTTGCSVTVGDLFTYHSESRQLELTDSTYCHPRPGGGISIEEVETLLYRRDMLDMDSAAIRALFGELPAQAIELDNMAQHCC